jgi:hypothetical protein
MKVVRCSADSGYYASVVLNSTEWPPIDAAGEWMNRPIRKWVYDHCYPSIFFAAAGWILFERESDLMAFVLAWS